MVDAVAKVLLVGVQAHLDGCCSSISVSAKVQANRVDEGGVTVKESGKEAGLRGVA